MLPDPEKYKRLISWLKSNVGLKFKVREDNVFTTYKDHKGRAIKMTAPAKNPDELVISLKYYIDTTGRELELPGVEFSNDYTKFKIYEKC